MGFPGALSLSSNLARVQCARARDLYTSLVSCRHNHWVCLSSLEREAGELVRFATFVVCRKV
jgi:hypothetical protein